MKARVIKKAICFAISLMLVMAMMPAAFANGPTAGADGTTVTISGTVVDGNGNPLPGKEVTVLVLKPGETIETIDMENPINSISYIDQVTSGDNGEYSFVYSLGDNPVAGEYTVMVGGEDIDEPAVVKFTYGSQSSAPAATIAVNSKAIGKIVEVSLDTDTPENYTVFVEGQQLFYSETRNLFVGLFDSSSAVSESSAVTVEETAVTDEYKLIYGNLDANTNITTNDAFEVVKIAVNIITNPTAKAKLASDVDANGNITTNDAFEIVKKAVSINTGLFPVEQQ